MLSCREINDLITDYLEGRMGLWDRMQFRLHIAMCGSCKLHVEKMRQMIGAMGQIPPKMDVPVELMEQFRNWKPKK